MKRLTYSPRVAAYVRTDEGIIDLSSYIVSGQVNRVVNEVSTASLVIRNPDKRFTTPGKPTFRPMDEITIFASRFRERPVQLFTGYLDQTPYLQLFPGTCNISASCTLKRLMYTYFDPGLPFTINFLKQYGWIPDIQTGQIINPVAQASNKVGNNGKSQGQGSQQKGDETFQQYRDGSIGNLMYAVLNTIGGWDPGQIKIEQFPTDAVKTVRDILASMRDDEQQAQTELNTFLTKLIGPYNPGSGGTGATTGGTPGGGVTGGASPPAPGQTATAVQIGAAMLRAGFPCDAQVIANGIQTSYNESRWGAIDQPPSGCCHGYWQLNKDNSDYPGDTCAHTLDCATKYALKLWQAGSYGHTNCFACGGTSGPGGTANPWQAGTDSATSFKALAQKLINEMCGSGGSAGGGPKAQRGGRGGTG